MNALMNQKAASMTSVEIAELVGSRHDKVKQSIERLAKRGVIHNPPLRDYGRINGLGLKQGFHVYVFEGEQGKRDSIVVAAQLCPEFTARLVDRWTELESKLQLISKIESIDEIAALKKEIMRLKAQIWHAEEMAAGERRINEIVCSKKSTDQKIKELVDLAHQNWRMRCDELQERVNHEVTIETLTKKNKLLESHLELLEGIEFKSE